MYRPETEQPWVLSLSFVTDVYPDTNLSSCLNAEVRKAQRTGNYSRSNELFQTIANLKLSKAELI